MSLAGTCIAVASASLIHVPPIQHVLKHCRTHIILIYYNIYIHVHDPQEYITKILCPKIVLRSANKIEM